MNQRIRNRRKISKRSSFSFSYSYLILYRYRLVNEIDEFENDDASTTNNISVTSFRSAGESRDFNFIPLEILSFYSW